MIIRAAGTTDYGCERHLNEDYFISRPDVGLYLVCDGMGGKDAGDLAASTAASSVERFIFENRKVFQLTESWASSREAVVALVRTAVEIASAEVFKLATEKGRVGMGTTLTLLLVCGNKGVMGHVGDSRLYLSRGDELFQLSEDHNFLSEMKKKSPLPQNEKVLNSPYAKALTRAVGIQNSVKCDVLVFDILPDDTFLLCTDGLSRYIEAEKLAAFLHEIEDLETLTMLLTEMANDCGGKDNITTLVARALADENQVDSARHTEVSLRLATLRDLSLFRGLSMKELVTTLECFTSRVFEAGQDIIAEGAADSCVFVLLEGELAVTRSKVEVARLKEGTHFGEMSLLTTVPRTATVTSLSRARLLVLDKADFDELLIADPVLGVKVLRNLARELSDRLQATTGKVTTRVRSRHIH